MPSIPKKILDRYKKEVPVLQKVLKTAIDRELNEADTVSIVKGILSDVFGFDKYLEITSEYAIRGTYCDLAIKMDGKIQYLIEVKAVWTKLNYSHLRQAVNYGANEGVKWIVLTNGIQWKIYKLKIDQKVEEELVFEFNFLEMSPRKAEDQELLYLLSKRGVAKSARDDYYERVQSVNRYVISALLLSEPYLGYIRRDLKKLAASAKVDNSEIEKIIRHEVIKREVDVSDELSKAKSRIAKMQKKTTRRKTVTRKSEAKAQTIVPKS